MRPSINNYLDASSNTSRSTSPITREDRRTPITWQHLHICFTILLGMGSMDSKICRLQIANVFGLVVFLYVIDVDNVKNFVLKAFQKKAAPKEVAHNTNTEYVYVPVETRIYHYIVKDVERVQEAATTQLMHTATQVVSDDNQKHHESDAMANRILESVTSSTVNISAPAKKSVMLQWLIDFTTLLPEDFQEPKPDEIPREVPIPTITDFLAEYLPTEIEAIEDSEPIPSIPVVFALGSPATQLGFDEFAHMRDTSVTSEGTVIANPYRWTETARKHVFISQAYADLKPQQCLWLIATCEGAYMCRWLPTHSI